MICATYCVQCHGITHCTWRLDNEDESTIVALIKPNLWEITRSTENYKGADPRTRFFKVKHTYLSMVRRPEGWDRTEVFSEGPWAWYRTEISPAKKSQVKSAAEKARTNASLSYALASVSKRHAVRCTTQFGPQRIVQCHPFCIVRADTVIPSNK